MKKTYYLLLLFAVLSARAKAQTDWITKKLDENMSIKFPSEPQKTTRNGIDVYVAKEKDSVLYSAAMVDIKSFTKLDSAALVPIKDGQKFADQLVATMVAQKQNYTFGNVTIGKWKNFTAYNFSGSEKTNKNALYIKMILIGSKLYTYSCRVPAELVTKNDTLFFNSTEMVK